MGLRVIAGAYRGRRLVAPEGLGTRPTPDRVREALFSILGGVVRGSTFLDLFAGSGAVGIEALSRGAESVVFVESGRSALAALRRNLQALDIAGRVVVVAAGWPEAAETAAASGPFSIIFADPPYEGAPYREILERLGGVRGLLSPDPRVVLEHEARAGIPDEAGGLKLNRIKIYGRVALGFYASAG